MGPALWGFIVGELGIGLGYPGMPHVITRYMAAKNDREVRRLGIIAMLWGITVFYGAGVAGLAGRALMPELVDGERALMALALQLLPPVLAGVLLAAIISAILSTVSSQLLVAASAVSYDLVEETLGRARDDRRSLILGRWTVAFVGLLGVARRPARRNGRLLVRTLCVVRPGGELRSVDDDGARSTIDQPLRRPRLHAHRRRCHGRVETGNQEPDRSHLAGARAF